MTINNSTAYKYIFQFPELNINDIELNQAIQYPYKFKLTHIKWTNICLTR